MRSSTTSYPVRTVHGCTPAPIVSHTLGKLQGKRGSGRGSSDQDTAAKVKRHLLWRRPGPNRDETYIPLTPVFPTPLV